MNSNSISFLQEEYQGSLSELGNKFNSVNGILKDILMDLTNETQSLQNEKKYEKVISVVQVQKELSTILDNNTNLIERLGIDYNESPTVKTKPTKKTTVKRPSKVNLSNYESTDEYAVNTAEPHELESDLRFKRPHAFGINNHHEEVATWKEMLVRTCEYLYKLDPDKFKSFADDDSMQWGKTHNFDKNKDIIREPHIVGDSGVYVEIAKGALGVRQLIVKMLKSYNIDPSAYKVYLRADYSAKRELDDSYRRRSSK